MRAMLCFHPFKTQIRMAEGMSLNKSDIPGVLGEQNITVCRYWHSIPSSNHQNMLIISSLIQKVQLPLISRREGFQNLICSIIPDSLKKMGEVVFEKKTIVHWRCFTGDFTWIDVFCRRKDYWGGKR